MGKQKKKDTYSYKGWLNSDSFWKRAFAIYGYSTVAAMVIMIPIYLIIIIIFVIIKLSIG